MGLVPKLPLLLGYIQNSWMALYCRCPSVSWRVSLCQLEVSFCPETLSFLATCLLSLSGPGHPVNHNPDTLNFLELLLGCCPGSDVIQIHMLDVNHHPGSPMASDIPIHPGWHPGLPPDLFMVPWRVGSNSIPMNFRGFHSPFHW